MSPFRSFALLAKGLRLLALLAAVAAGTRAQTTLVIDSSTRTVSSGAYTYNTWKPLFGVEGSGQTGPDGWMIDPITDQQTGQSDSDFASGGAGNFSAPGFFVQAGTINGVQHLGFRIMLNEYKTTGNLVNIRVGFDGNYDGKVDLFMGPSLQSNQYGLVFQSPGSGLNTSPSTTTLGNAFYPTSAGVGNALAFTSSNFSNIEISSVNAGTYYPGWTIADEDATDNKAALNDAMISFAIPLADINAALAQAGAGFTINASTLMRWVAFTATQNNSINQDVYGLPKITNSNGVGDTSYSAFLPYMDASGRPVPEPSSYGLLLGGGLLAAFGLRRRRRPARRDECRREARRVTDRGSAERSSRAFTSVFAAAFFSRAGVTLAARDRHHA